MFMNNEKEARVYWVNLFCSNEMKELRKRVDKIILKFGGVNGSDKDDFYSMSQFCLLDSLDNFDSEKIPWKDFDKYFFGNLNRKCVSLLRDRNTEKRKANFNGNTVSYDTPLSEDGYALQETLADDRNDIEKILFSNSLSKNMQNYLDNLTEVQKEILFMLAEGFSKEEICDSKGIGKKEVNECIRTIKDYENTKVLLYM